MTVPRTISAIDVHAAGEPGRVVMSEDLGIEGATMAERLRFCREHLDGLRRLLLQEPRGYPGLCGVIVLPPVHDDSDFGIIVLEQGGFAPMSGANLICAVTALVETQAIDVTEPLTTLRVDTASGLVQVRAEITAGRVTDVELDNVPAFAVAIDRVLDLPEYGAVPVDIVFGGQFYVQAAAADLGVSLDPVEAQEVIRAANSMLAVARRDIPVSHPLHPELDRIDLPMIHGPSATDGVDGRNTVVMPHGEPDPDDPATWRGGTLDRSPGGTGTCGRMVALHARGQLGLDRPFVHQSVIDTTFTGRLRERTQIDDREAVLPTISGRGWITGFHQFVIADDDPFPTGYTLSDLWGSTSLGGNS